MPRRTQVELDHPGAKADTSAASETVNDVGKKPRKLRKVSELKQECSELKEEANSPGRPGEEPDEPGGETAVPGDPITYQEGPIGGASKAGGETSASDQDTSSGGHKGEEESSRVVEGESDRESIVDHAGCDGIRPRSRKNERRAETDALC